MENAIKTQEQQKHVGKSEFVLYLVAVFFYTTMTGMVGGNRNAYLVNVLRLSEDQVSFFNVVTAVVPFILNFFIAMYIDGRKMGKAGKFRPLVLLAAIPMAIVMVLSFWTPTGLSGTILMVYVITLAIVWAVLGAFGTQSIWLPML